MLKGRLPAPTPTLRRAVSCRRPWRLLWVRYGYDPRKDISARMYQTIDFRLPR